jgi:hypothetical protein
MWWTYARLGPGTACLLLGLATALPATADQGGAELGVTYTGERMAHAAA